MLGEYIITEEIHQHMVDIISRDTGRLEQLKEEINVAKSYGDLSENSTYEFLITEQDNLMDITKDNINYLSKCKVLSKEEIVEQNLPVYSTYGVTISDISTENEESYTFVLTPSIELNIKNSITLSSDIGSYIYNGEVGSNIFIEKDDAAIVMSINSIENCMERSVEFDR